LTAVLPARGKNGDDTGWVRFKPPIVTVPGQIQVAVDSVQRPTPYMANSVRRSSDRYTISTIVPASRTADAVGTIRFCLGCSRLSTHSAYVSPFPREGEDICHPFGAPRLRSLERVTKLRLEPANTLQACRIA
jgi:hypothetical protein